MTIRLNDSLRRYTLKVLDQSGGIGIATAFRISLYGFVTNAHVLSGSHSCILGLADDTAEVRAHVLGASARQTDLQQPEWPYPDLCLLEIENLKDFPTSLVPVIPVLWSSARLAGPTFSWAWAPREEGLAAHGELVEFATMSRDGDGRLNLTGSSLRHGMSGSPLVSTVTHRVVGVLSDTRPIGLVHGGYAVEVADLPRIAPVQGKEGRLAAVIEESRTYRLNQDEAREWSSVFDIARPVQVENPSFVFHRAAGSTPSQMLVASHRVVPASNVQSLLDGIAAWRNTSESVQLGIVEAGGGSGKTRIALEAILSAETDRWLAGFVHALDDSLLHCPRSRMLILDYAEHVPSLGEWVRSLVATADPLFPVRILLLLRGQADRVLEEMRQYAQAQFIVDSCSYFEVPSLSNRQDEHFGLAVRSFEQAWSGTATAPTHAPVKTPDSVLSMHILALNRVLNLEMPAHSPMVNEWGQLLAHESRYWPSDTGLPNTEMRLMLAVATLMEGESQEDVQNICSACSDMLGRVVPKAAIEWLCVTYPGEKLINGLRPDPIAEWLIREVRASPLIGVSLLPAVFAHASAGQLGRISEVLLRILEADGWRGQLVADTLDYSQTAHAGLLQRLGDDSASAATRSAWATIWSRLEAGSFSRPESLLQFLESLTSLSLLLQADMQQHGSFLVQQARHRVGKVLFRLHPITTNATALAAIKEDLALQALRIGKGRSALILRISAVDMLQRFLTIDADETELVVVAGFALLRLGESYGQHGAIDQAFAAFGRLGSIMENRNDVESMRLTGLASKASASLHRMNQNMEAAHSYAQSAYAVSERLAKAEPTNEALQQDYCRAAIEVGRVGMWQADVKVGLRDLLTALSVVKEISLNRPETVDNRKLRLEVAHHLADAYSLAGEDDNASLFRRTVYIETKNDLAADPDNVMTLRDFATEADRMASAALHSGDLDGARVYNNQSRGARERLISIDSDTWEHTRELLVCARIEATIALREEKLDLARGPLIKLKAQLLELTAAHPQSTVAKWDLAIAIELLARTWTVGDRRRAALLREACTVHEDLYRSDPSNVARGVEGATVLYLLAIEGGADDTHLARLDAYMDQPQVRLRFEVRMGLQPGDIQRLRSAAPEVPHNS